MNAYGEIETVHELVQEVSNQRTGGYEVDFDIKPNQERARAGDGFFLIIDVQSTEPDPEVSVNGEWWFWNDGKVMQVL